MKNNHVDDESFPLRKFHILKSLYDYFIMHDIKYFFLNKRNQII
jgi:hypothetical protein